MVAPVGVSLPPGAAAAAVAAAGPLRMVLVAGEAALPGAAGRLNSHPAPAATRATQNHMAFFFQLERPNEPGPESRKRYSASCRSTSTDIAGSASLTTKPPRGMTMVFSGSADGADTGLDGTAGRDLAAGAGGAA